MNLAIKRTVVTASLLFAMPLAMADWRQLNVAETIQEHSQWCWSGSSRAVMKYYGTNDSQCYIVNWAFGINYACGNNTFNWNSNANQPNNLYGSSGSVQSILLNLGGISNTAYTYASSWNSVTWDINNNRPFVMRYGWTNGGGHIMVGDGWENYNGTKYIYIMNPWPGEGQEYRTYSSAVSASDHQWTHTLRMNR